MKRIEKLYFILTYMFFIYPPFIFGLVSIYQTEQYEESVHITSLIVNLILIVVLVGILAALIKYKKLHIPNKLEIKYLIFGFIGNIAMYFYTFQNAMKIDDFVTIYLILLVVLAADYFLISNKFKVKELWVLLTLFLVVDYAHLLLTGCGFADSWDCAANHTYDVLIIILYSITVLTILAYYGYRILSYKLFDLFKILNVIFVVIMSYAFANEVIMEEKFILTIFIFMPFFVIVDFIVSIVNKTYTHKTLLFYIRSTTILSIFGVLGAFNFFEGEIDINILSLMVATTYASLLISIMKPLLKIDVKEDTPLKAIKQSFSGVHLYECTEIHKDLIKEQYGEKQCDHIVLETNSYSLVAIIDNNIVGFISTYIKPLPSPLENLNEGYINIIEVHEKFRKQGIATRLIEKTEKYLKQNKIAQIRGWSSNYKLEAITLWNQLHYSLSSTTIWIEEKKVSVEGYYYIKKLN